MVRHKLRQKLSALGGRKLVAVGAIFTIVAAVGGGWGLAKSFESPSQREAAARAPAAGPITSEVVSGRLERTVSTRVHVSRASEKRATVPSQGDNSVVTAAPKPIGAQIGAGRMLLEVDGRPVFSMPGAFGFYRDMRPGMNGPDVAQLQQGLRQAGYAVTADGRFGAATARAVQSMYAASSHTALSTPALGPGGETGATGAASRRETQNEASDQGQTEQVPTELLVPRSEFIVVPQLPAWITEIPTVGTPLGSGTSASFQFGEVVATADISASTSEQLRPGLPATLSAESMDSITGTVSSLVGASAATTESTLPAQKSGSRGASGEAPSGEANSTRLVIAGADAPLAEALLGKDLLAVIPYAISSAEALIVPSIAVVAAGHRNPRVFKKRPDGSFQSVEVAEFARLDGRSAIKPTKPGQLKIGDLVRVG